MSNLDTARQRYTGRLVIDHKMGELYDWVSTLSGRARSRELLNLVRLGFHVSKGNLQYASPIGEPPSSTNKVDPVPTRPESKAQPQNGPIDEAALLREAAIAFEDAVGGMEFAPPPDDFH